MKMNQSNSKYRILVVKGQSNYSHVALKNAVNLAKKIDGSIDVLHVKSPLQVIGSENQLAAWRELKKESADSKRTLKEEVESLAASAGVPAHYNFSVGNITSLVQQQIDSTQPDVVVLGKSNTWIKEILGIDLVSYLLKNFNGALLISKEKETLDALGDLSLGLLDDFRIKGESKLLQDLEKNTAKPVTLLKISSKSTETESQQTVGSMAVKTFEFEDGANAKNSVSRYIERSGINLLLMSKHNLREVNNQIKELSRQIQRSRKPVLVL